MSASAAIDSLPPHVLIFAGTGLAGLSNLAVLLIARSRVSSGVVHQVCGTTVTIFRRARADDRYVHGALLQESAGRHALAPIGDIRIVLYPALLSVALTIGTICAALGVRRT